jgi:hypothetical protein
MDRSKKIIGLSASLLLAGLVAGCGGSPKIQGSEMPGKAMLKEGAEASKAGRTQLERYIVKNRDCLWEIAGKPRVYDDPFQWPELYKANRDQIKDPDLIYPRQTLTVSKGYSLEEKERAKRMAMNTPKFVPHTKPRETLPVEYF